MDLERDYEPFLVIGIISLLCMLTVTLGGVSVAGVWMDAMYPIFFLFSVAGFSVSWIRWKKRNEKD